MKIIKKIQMREWTPAVLCLMFVAAYISFASTAQATTLSPALADSQLIEKGRRIFFNETFNGNGRTCGTCHRAENNFTIDPKFIATLPPNDPLFVAEFIPALKENFENPRLMRKFGLILENQDGFDDLANNFNMRGVPHVLAQRTSIDSEGPGPAQTPPGVSAGGPRTGWSGDGAPNDGSGSPPLDGSLRAFAIGAVTQHFTKTTDRMAGVDFRRPTDAELNALEAFQLSLGRQQDLALPLPLKGTVAKRGQEIFLDDTLGKCNACHFNAGANADPALFGPLGLEGNLNFDTGVENLPDQPADLTGELVPPDDGFGTPGDNTFNTPSLVEAADTGPFFHNNSIETIEGSVAFYNGAAFTNSPAGQLIIGATGSGIVLDGTQVVAVAAFLRVINALENIRESISSLNQASMIFHSRPNRARRLLRAAVNETSDSMAVLDGGGLHPLAVQHLRKAQQRTRKVLGGVFFPRNLILRAIKQQQRARRDITQ